MRCLVPAATGAAAAGMAARALGNRNPGFLQNPIAAGNHASNGSARLGMVRQSVLPHALLDLKLGMRLIHGFVNVSRHNDGAIVG